MHLKQVTFLLDQYNIKFYQISSDNQSISTQQKYPVEKEKKEQSKYYLKQKISIMDTIYVRVKRENMTIFFVCRTTDSIESLRKRLVTFYKVQNTDMRLFLGDRLLDPTSNIYDQDVKNNSLLILKLRAKNQLEWEE
ncbi:hypothetical protein TTHERM_000047248 (macronuclear) [Tetrahymena thermophila SB210]|uniref:Ubiquitin-like domain-containing protein n=1 Tax=Tetrahymena thermophila (strain SB210) TaxID=312017 RepID=W7X5G6_TETTS|nr:hypothetical protein TTHERM_000047248 [Tetrahymena thermophila SB210]EWS74615.1 hypothetical protein TTHERM_000047248 [Tetrahymena thermophila SB210]|eukprot:XP_012652837.1 hypothetical protein TTHERM_000047248 [Tetrahymena thermophila SB210]